MNPKPPENPSLKAATPDSKLGPIICCGLVT